MIGEMLEWLKRHAWKACVPQKGIARSNLALAAVSTKKSPVSQALTGDLRFPTSKSTNNSGDCGSFD